MPARTVADQLSGGEGFGPGEIWVIGGDLREGHAVGRITEYDICRVVEQTDMVRTADLADLPEPLAGCHLARRVVRIVHHDQVGAWRNFVGPEAERVGRTQRQGS